MSPEEFQAILDWLSGKTTPAIGITAGSIAAISFFIMVAVFLGVWAGMKVAKGG